MTIREQLHNSETHKPGFDPACPKCVSETPEAIAEREYQSEIEAQPRYHDGAPRPQWSSLSAIARWQRVRIANGEVLFD